MKGQEKANIKGKAQFFEHGGKEKMKAYRTDTFGGHDPQKQVKKHMW